METVKEKVNEDNAKAFARIKSKQESPELEKLIDKYLKLKNDVAEFTAIIENQFLQSISPISRPILGAIVQSDKFKDLQNQTK